MSIAMAGTLGVAEQAMEQGFYVRATMAWAYSSQSLKELKRLLGFAGLPPPSS
ncbi:MAG: hypothetical protein V8S34_02300 [Lawsonibacter sp.]